MKNDYPEMKYDSKELRSFANAADNKINEARLGGFVIGFVACLLIIAAYILI